MADVTFFENDNFGGRQFTVGQYVPNFRDSGFNDRAQSRIVSGGSWEVCVDRDFGGGCTVLRARPLPDSRQLVGAHQFRAHGCAGPGGGGASLRAAPRQAPWPRSELRSCFPDRI